MQSRDVPADGKTTRLLRFLTGFNFTLDVLFLGVVAALMIAASAILFAATLLAFLFPSEAAGDSRWEPFTFWLLLLTMLSLWASGRELRRLYRRLRGRSDQNVAQVGQDALILPRSRYCLWLDGVLYVAVMVLAATFLITSDAGPAYQLFWTVLVAWMAFILLQLRLMSQRTGPLELRPEGLIDHSFPPISIPWHHIEHVRVHAQHAPRVPAPIAHYLLIKLRHSAPAELKQHWAINLLTKVATLSFFRGSLHLRPMNDLCLAPEVAEDLIQGYWFKHRTIQ